MPDIFLSYSRDDQTIARRFADGFEREGFSVWWDATLHSGEAYDQVTEKALREARAVVVLWSRSSVDSRWVRAEATTADRNKTLVPVMIEPCIRPVMFELTHTADLTHWNGASGDKDWQAYVADVRRFVARDAPQPAVPIRVVRPNGGLRWKRSGMVTAVVLALLAIAAGVQWALNRTRPVDASLAGAPRTAIAVMPFANLTGDPGKDYLGDGMAEELINTLAKVDGLRVPARTSSFSYKGRNTDAKQIAAELKIGTILEGSVRSAGETIRISATLIDAQTDSHLWSETYDRKFTDLFKLQDDLAAAIVQALQVNLHGGTPASVTQAPPTKNVAAYQLYLQGRSIESRSRESDLREALAIYQQVQVLDPGFARAYAASSNLRLAIMGIGYPLPDALPDAERDAIQALALDPKLAYAHTALGTVHAIRGRWRQAEAEFRTAIAQDPGDPLLRNDYCDYMLDSAGLLQQSMVQRNEAYRLAPSDVIAVMDMAAGNWTVGRDADAIRYADVAVKLGFPADGLPLPHVYTSTDARAGRYTQAADRFAVRLPAAARAAGGDDVIRHAFAAIGNPAQRPAAVTALQGLVEKLDLEALNPNDRKFIVQIFVQLDALDPAFRMANQLLDQHDRSGTVGSIWGILWTPEMRPFRRDPRFQDFVKRLGLIDYWKQYGAPDGCKLSEELLACG